MRRRAYDLSTFPEKTRRNGRRKTRGIAGMASELIMLQSELAREIHAETQFSGALLQKVRESQGVEIADIAAKTKIAANHLRAIEQDDFERAARAGLHPRLRPRAGQVLATRPLAGGRNVPEANARSARSLRGPHRELGA